MKIAGLLIALVVTASVLIGMFVSVEQSLDLAGTSNPRVTQAKDNMTLFTDSVDSKMDTLQEKMDALAEENQATDSSIMGFFQSLPGLLDISLSLLSIATDLPSMMLYNVSAMFPWLPVWFVPMISAVVLIFVLLKLYFALRGTSEV